MAAFIAIGAVCVVATFCVWQFCDLMQRRDDEFPGRYDKPVWAAAILLGNVFGSVAYWLSKQGKAPAPNESLKREYEAALERRAAASDDAPSVG